MSDLLSIENLRVSFGTDEGRLVAVDDVSLTIRPGEVLGLVGESGCGKSVTAMSILRLIPAPAGHIEAGRIRFHGEDLLTLPIARLRTIRGRAISMIFQEPMTALSPLHRIGAQLVEAQRLHSDISTAAAEATAAEWLDKVGIPDPRERLRAYPFELSGGMRQRVMIAMAMMLDPELIIADEPTTALDVTVQAQIFALLRAMKKTSTAILLITHDMGVIWEMCDRVAVMYASEIVEIADTESLFRKPLHPYTEALLKSVPSLTRTHGRLPAIPGQVPSGLAYPTGCRFADRCALVQPACRLAHPPLETHADRACRCILTAARQAAPPPTPGPETKP